MHAGEPVGINDGITLTNCPETPCVRDLSEKAGADPPVGSGNGRQLPVIIFGIADGIGAA